jgi:hypothetical protein
MIDFTPIVEAIISLAVTAITVFLIPWLRERYGNESLEKARGWVQIAVYAAEKLYGAGHGDEKLAYAQQVLAKHKIKLDMITLKAMIDAEIKQMEQMEEYIEVLPEGADEDGNQ